MISRVLIFERPAVIAAGSQTRILHSHSPSVDQRFTRQSHGKRPNYRVIGFCKSSILYRFYRIMVST